MLGTPRQTRWLVPDGLPRARVAVVDVWQANLDGAPKEIGGLLCASERARAQRFRSERDRRRWSASRGILRSILALHLGHDPRDLRFELGEKGKPALGDGEKLRFNLSHSGQIALYAVSESWEVGVDVEVSRPGIDVLALAARVLGADELQRLTLLEGEERRMEFLRSWVAHEAAVKCRGGGLGSTTEQIAAEGLSLQRLDVGPSAAAALAVEGPAQGVRCWSWGPQPL